MATFDNDHNARRTSSEDRLLAVLGFVAGIGALVLTWYFYHDYFTATSFTWLGLVQPALMLAGGGVSLFAAAMLLGGQPDGRETLKFGLSFLPFVLLWRLLVFVARMIWEGVVWGISFAQGQASTSPLEGVYLTPFNILNIVVIVVVIVVSAVRWDRSRRK